MVRQALIAKRVRKRQPHRDNFVGPESRQEADDTAAQSQPVPIRRNDWWSDAQVIEDKPEAKGEESPEARRTPVRRETVPASPGPSREPRRLDSFRHVDFAPAHSHLRL
jgi:hypothetical protein